MDGGGRLLRSLGGSGARLAPLPFVLAGAGDGPLAFPVPRTAPQLPARKHRRRHRSMRLGLERLAASRFVGTVLVLALLGGSIGFGAVRGGEYAAFVAANGSLADVVARAAGFPVKAVTVTGTRELTDREILKLADIGPHNSLLFLDVAALRARLTSIPLIKDASVSKLYPNRLLVEVEERQPSALWQKDGAVSIVAMDGTPIDDMHDPRFKRLPLVVGVGANQRLSEYLGILESAGALRERIAAGIFVAGRRWTLKTVGGIAIDLPEKNPAGAIASLAALEHDDRILEKDVVSLDLRIPGRVVAKLTADAAAARAESLAKKTKKKGAA